MVALTVHDMGNYKEFSRLNNDVFAYKNVLAFKILKYWHTKQFFIKSEHNRKIK